MQVLKQRSWDFLSLKVYEDKSGYLNERDDYGEPFSGQQYPRGS